MQIIMHQFVMYTNLKMKSLNQFCGRMAIYGQVCLAVSYITGALSNLTNHVSLKSLKIPSHTIIIVT